MLRERLSFYCTHKVNAPSNTLVTELKVKQRTLSLSSTTTRLSTTPSHHNRRSHHALGDVFTGCSSNASIASAAVGA